VRVSILAQILGHILTAPYHHYEVPQYLAVLFFLLKIRHFFSASKITTIGPPKALLDAHCHPLIAGGSLMPIVILLLLAAHCVCYRRFIVSSGSVGSIPSSHSDTPSHHALSSNSLVFCEGGHLAGFLDTAIDHSSEEEDIAAFALSEIWLRYDFNFLIFNHCLIRQCGLNYQLPF
jgi:hypothetical protein